MKIIDEVYMLTKNEDGIWYSPPATSTMECWKKAYQWETYQFEAITKQESYETFRNRMIREGWIVRKVKIGLGNAS